MSWFAYIAVAIFFFALLILITYITYLKWIIRTSFTRERFAFQALWINTAASMFALAAFVGPEPPWAAVANIASALLGLSYRVEASPSPINALFAFVLLAFLLYWTQQIFRHWNGPVSARQNEQTAKNEPASLIREGLWEARRLVRRQPASTIADQSSEHRFQSIIAGIEPSPWPERARELVSLKRTYLSFNSDYDWHQEYNVWIGENRHTNDVVGLVCVDSAPSEYTLVRTAAYVGRIAGGRVISLIVACRQDIKQHFHIDNVEIECITENILLEDLIDFDEYYRSIEARVNRKTLPDSSLVLNDVYTPSRILSEQNYIISEDASYFIESWLSEPGDRQIVIYGGYGQGKSTSTLMATHSIIQKIKAGESHRIPIFIELRGKSPSTLGVNDLLAAWAYPYRIDPRALIRLLETGRLAIFFDGFDEMADAGTVEARFGHFTSLWRFNLPGTKILFTGRPQFLTEQEKGPVFGNGRNLAVGTYCQTLALAPFDNNRINDSLRKFPDSVREAIAEKARRDQRFNDIVSRASLLYVVAHLWDKPELAGAWDSITSSSVISLFIQHSYRRQSEKIRGSLNFMPLGENERAYFMQGVAVYMAKKLMPNQISREDFESIVRKLYESAPEDLRPQYAAQVSGPSDRPLKIRMIDDATAVEKICTDIRTFGILENDPSRSGMLRFAHKSFFEVLFSEFIKDSIIGSTSSTHRKIAFVTKSSLEDAEKMDLSRIFCAELLYNEYKDMDVDNIFYKIHPFGSVSFLAFSYAQICINSSQSLSWQRSVYDLNNKYYLKIHFSLPVILYIVLMICLIVIKSTFFFTDAASFIGRYISYKIISRQIIFLEYCICAKIPDELVRGFIKSNSFRKILFSEFAKTKYARRYEKLLPYLSP